LSIIVEDKAILKSLFLLLFYKLIYEPFATRANSPPQKEGKEISLLLDHPPPCWSRILVRNMVLWISAFPPMD
jgi:hypothetical protein